MLKSESLADNKYSQKTHEDIRTEYDHLFCTEGVRDEDRAYRWHAQNLLKFHHNAKTILDIACGAGYFFRELELIRPNYFELTGIDISSTALKLAKAEHARGVFTQGIAEDLPFKNETFDALTCLGSLEHFLDTRKAIEQMHRVAKRDAIFYIMVPNMFWYRDILSILFYGRKVTRNQSNERFESLYEWRDILQSYGLRVKTILKYNGIAQKPIKQYFKDLLIPLRFSYHFIFICTK